MRLYHIIFDDEDYFVEASSFAMAVMAWRGHVQKEWGVDYDGTEEPDSCQLLHIGAVIRAES